jgi:copper transport protein
VRRRTRWGSLAGLLAVIATLALAGPASAHAGLQSSDPEAGAVLTEAPPSVTLSFTEPPDLDLSSIQVFNAAGQEIATGDLIEGSIPRSLQTELSADLPDGVYTVSWAVVSEADGHGSAGAFAFGVGVDPGTGPVPNVPTQETPAPSGLSIASKIALYVGIVLAIGTAVAGLWTMPGELPARRSLSIIAGALGAVGAVGMLVAEGRTLGVSLDELLSSTTGRNYLWLLGTAGFLLVCSLAAGFTTSREPLVLMGLAAVTVAIARATGGHAAAAIPSWPQELAQTVHIGAVGVWIGGFIPILLLLRAKRLAGEEPPTTEVARFSRSAGWAVLVVVLTGGIRVVDEAGGIGAVRDLVFDTSYGTTLVVKVALVAGLIVLGALNRRRSIPRLASGDGLLSRVMTVEAVGALLVLSATGLLTGLNPEPVPPAPPQRPPAIVADGSDFATTMRVRLTASPGTPGPNDFDVRVTDYDSGEDVVATAVQLTFEPVGRPQVNASSLDLRQSGSGSWIGEGTQLSLAGVWNVTALVQAGSKGTEIPMTLVTATPGSTQQVVATLDGPDIVTTTLTTGQSIQAYVDPGTAGPNDVHVTAFDEQGEELPLSEVLVIVTPQGGDPQSLEAKRLTPGHFSAPAELDPGSLQVVIVAVGKDGSVLQASFDQTIGT